MDIGPILNEFKAFTEEFEPKADHEAAAAVAAAADGEEEENGETEDQFHYIAYVFVDGNLWELDGLQQGPIPLTECTKETWLDAARMELKAKMVSYGDGEDHFVLLAVVRDPLLRLKAQLDKLKEERIDDDYSHCNSSNSSCSSSTNISNGISNGGDNSSNTANNVNIKIKVSQDQTVLEEIKEVEREIANISQEREAEKREIREIEADFSESIDIFMKALVELQEQDRLLLQQQEQVQEQQEQHQ
ncbi:hypothetical protein BGZ76_001401, partial [Entomortierella beljakovae]